MDTLNFQEVIPLSAWAFSSAVGMMIMLIAFFLYLYYRNRLRAVVGDGSNAADLAGKVAQLKKDEETIRDWLTSQKDELQRVASEREEQIQLQAQLSRLEQECAQKEENKKHLLTENHQKVEQKIVDLEKCLEEMQGESTELTKVIEQYKLEKKELQKECDKLAGILEKKKKDFRDLEQESREAGNDVEFLRDEYSSLKKKIDALKEREQEVLQMHEKKVALQLELDDLRNEVATEQKTKKEIIQKLEEHNDEINELKNKKSALELKIDSVNLSLKDLDSDYETINEKVNKKTSEHDETKFQIIKAEQELATIKDKKDQADEQVKNNIDEIEKLKTEETSLKARIETLKVLAKKYSKSLGLDENDEGKIKYRDLWQPVTFPPLPPANQTLDEHEMLTKTARYIRGQNLYFPERVLYAFHTALKVNEISPLVVLAGISGTGKSELPRRYAEGMGMHSVILAVQPRWDSPQDLFGFYNYLEERYKATELARAMVQFERFNRKQWPMPDDWNHDRSDRMLLVLLDEMNLARVEYYFSEFLSRLETRRGIDLNDRQERAKAEIALEMGSLSKNESPIRLFPGQNVLFSGTMNEDETTQALSDKVLDRSCVLRFGRPKKIKDFKPQPAFPQATNGLTLEQWASFLNNSLPDGDKDRVNSWINGLNDAMAKLHRPFGHRVAHAIKRYIANYPIWVPNRVSLAMADQIEQRILPKLRGIELNEAEQPLVEIRSVIQDVIQECNDTPLLEAFDQGRESQQQVFIWRGLDRTEESDF
jgi:predicted  nucleic acid-binding Zn-ribbon protein